MMSMNSTTLSQAETNSTGFPTKKILHVSLASNASPLHLINQVCNAIFEFSPLRTRILDHLNSSLPLGTKGWTSCSAGCPRGGGVATGGIEPHTVYNTLLYTVV